jgi:glycosyltransferase involved in cell wall biosynthesis
MQNIKSKLVSVIIPVYNGGDYLIDSISSIINQSYKNLEIIIINDGSSDNSDEIIKNLKDSRIVYINQKNQGLSSTLNAGIKISTGEFIARQDQDDISLPNRIQVQLDYLLNNNINFVGSRSIVIGDKGNKIGKHNHPLSSIACKLFLQFDNPFVHSSILARKDIFLNDLYSTELDRQPPEDYDLWCRLSKNFDMENVPQRLILYRQLQTGMSQSNSHSFLENVNKISVKTISSSLNRFDKNTICDLSGIYHGNIKIGFLRYLNLIALHFFLAIKISNASRKFNYEFLKIYIYQFSKISKNFFSSYV